VGILRDYQIKSVDSLREILKSGKRRPILVCATGSGKSVIMSKIISLVLDNDKKVLWMVHRRNLTFQMRDTLKEFFGIDSGIIMAGVDTDLENNVQLCTIQTYSRRINLGYFGVHKFLMDPDIVIIDECHRSISKSYQDILSIYHDKIIIGTTATPMRFDGRGMGEVYDSIVDVTSLKELTDRDYLVPVRYFVPNQINLKGVRTAMGEYMVKDLEGKMIKTKLIGDIVENWLRLAENRKTIVYAVNVKHSKAICEAFVSQGITAEHLDARSSDDERDAVFQRVQDGRTTIVCNVALYTEGLDIPSVSTIVIARPTKSMGLYRQMAGRGLRPAEGKKDVILLDHGNVIETHGLLDWEMEWTLDGKKRAWSKPSKRLTERLVKCRVCHKVFMGANVCPDCGTPVKSFGKKILTVEADLEEITKKEKFSMGEKRQWYGMFLRWAKYKKYLNGWVSHKYRGRFGVWPRGMDDVSPIEPTQEFHNYIKHLNIKFAKSRNKEKTQAALERGGELASEHELRQGFD